MTARGEIPPARFRQLSQAAAAITVVMGVGVLVGWWRDIDFLKSVIPGTNSMKVNTAVCFVLAGLSLWLLQHEGESLIRRDWRGRLGQALALIVTLIALLSLSQDFMGWNLGIDEFVFHDPTTIGVPGRIAPQTALAFVLLGAALLLLDVRTAKGAWLAQLLPALAGWIGFGGVVGHACGAVPLFRLGSLSARRKFSIAAAGICALVGTSVLIDWALGLRSLLGFGLDTIPMAPSTALLFVGYGIAVLLRAHLPLSRGAHWAGVAITSAGALAALLLLILSLQGIHPDIERLGLAAARTVDGVPVGHMSPVTAICFLLASLSFLGSLPSSSGSAWRAAAARWAAFFLLVASSVLLLAYLLGSPLLYGGSFIPPAATTSLAFVALGMALLILARPRETAAEAPQPAPYRLALVFVLLAAGIATAGGFYLRNEGRRYRTKEEYGLSAVAELKAGELAEWRSERLGDGSIFMENAAFSALVRRVFDNPQDAKARMQLRNLLTKVGTHYPYDRLSLLDARGAERLAVPEGRVPDSSVIERRVPEVLRSGEVTFQDFYRNEHDQRIYLSVLAPMYDGRGRPLGIVALRIDPEIYLFPFINRWPTPAQTVETLIVRREGNDALFLSELKFQKHTALRLRIPLTRQDVAAVKAALGQEGVVEARDYRGVPVLAALRAVPGSPWFLVARIDLAEVNAPLRKQLWEVVILVACLLAAAAAGVGMLWREQRLRHFRERYQAERRRAWLHAAIAGSLNEVYVFDPDSLRFRFANLGACRNIGYTQEELAGLTPLDIKPEFTAETFRAMLEPLRDAARPVRVFETVHRRKDGSDYPAEVHLQLVEADTGAAFLAIINDITERKWAETRIRHLNRVYAVLSEVNQAIVRLRQPQALFAEACRIAVETGGFRMAWLALLDAPTNTLRAAGQAGVIDGFLDQVQVVPRDGPGGLRPCASAARDGVHHVCNDIERDPRAAAWRDAALARGYRASAAFPLTVDGETLGVFALYASEPGFFDDEELLLLDEMAADLSLAMEMTRIEEGRLLLSAAIEQSPVSVVITDAGGRIDYVNPAFTLITGYAPEEALGRNPRLLKSGRQEPALYQELWATIRVGKNWHGELVNRRKDGSLYTQELAIAPVRNAAGDVAHFVGIGQDITEQRLLEQQFRQAQKMEAVGRLAGGIAHDFNNLLTVIRGYAELMLEETDREKLRSRAQNIMKASDRTAALTRQLLAFSRKQVLWPQVLDPNAVVAETQKMLPPLIGEDVQVIVIPGPKLGRVKADPGQLQQVLMNLAINARDAMPQGGKLVLETSNVECDQDYCAMHPGARPGSYVMFAVSDNGCGMDALTQAHIFEPFFTTKPKDKGTGLGLATVYGIVKQSGGHIYVYSEVGAGTTFKVYLPRVEEKGAAAPPPPRFAEQAAVTETILVVEDEEAVRHLTRMFLEQRGYSLLEARNGAEALEVAAAHAGPIHLLVTDMVMPGMRGRELAEKLSAARPQMKVLYVSGYTDGSIVENGELVPGSAFLEKPFSSDALARKVRQVLSGSSSGCERPGPEATEPAEKQQRIRT